MKILVPEVESYLGSMCEVANALENVVTTFFIKQQVTLTLSSLIIAMRY